MFSRSFTSWLVIFPKHCIVFNSSVFKIVCEYRCIWQILNYWHASKSSHIPISHPWNWNGIKIKAIKLKFITDLSYNYLDLPFLLLFLLPTALATIFCLSCSSCATEEWKRPPTCYSPFMTNFGLEIRHKHVTNKGTQRSAKPEHKDCCVCNCWVLNYKKV